MAATIVGWRPRSCRRRRSDHHHHPLHRSRSCRRSRSDHALNALQSDQIQAHQHPNDQGVLWGSYCRSGSRRPSAAKPGQVVVTQLVAAGAQGAHHVAPGHVNQGPRAQGWLSESTLQIPLQCQRLSYIAVSEQASKLTPPTLMPPWGRRHQCHHGRRSGWRRQRQQSRTKSRTKSRTPQQAHKHRNHRQT